MESLSPIRPPALMIGRTFLHPAVDYLAIGGGISLAAAAALWLISGFESVDGPLAPYMAGFFLASNSAHFAASTVRLYTKPGAFGALPFLTLAFPVVTLLVTISMILLPGTLAGHYYSLYLTWSPYHYCAQAYGLSLMYCYRSGLKLEPGDKRAVWWACMAAFAAAITSSPTQRAGIWWVLDHQWLHGHSAPYAAVMTLRSVLRAAAVAAPFALLGWFGFRRRITVPAISILVIAVNAAWFVFFPLLQGFALATICHGIQYLFIVGVFHVRDQTMLPHNRRPAAWHAVWFYGACLLLGYALFALVPAGLAFAGFGPVESMLMVVTSINIHHFIVDGYIWKLGGDRNYKIVTQAQGQPRVVTPSAH